MWIAGQRGTRSGSSRRCAATDPELAANLRIEERELEASGLNESAASLFELQLDDSAA
jgi:hypothetical protein